MVFCSQVLTELDKFPFFSSFTHYLFLVDSQTAAATDLSSEIRKLLGEDRWPFVVTAIIIGVAVETGSSYFSAFRDCHLYFHLFPDLKKDFLNTFVSLLKFKIFRSIPLYLLIQLIFSLLSSIEDNVYVGLIIALVFGLIMGSLNPNLEQIDQLMSGFNSLSTIAPVSSGIKKILERYKDSQISIISPLDKKLVIKKTSLYMSIKPRFNCFQIVTIQKCTQKLIGGFTLKETPEKYQGRLDAIIGGNFSDEDTRERLIWLLFDIMSPEEINKITNHPDESEILIGLGKIESGE